MIAMMSEWYWVAMSAVALISGGVNIAYCIKAERSHADEV